MTHYIKLHKPQVSILPLRLSLSVLVLLFIFAIAYWGVQLGGTRSTSYWWHPDATLKVGEIEGLDIEFELLPTEIGMLEVYSFKDNKTGTAVVTLEVTHTPADAQGGDASDTALGYSPEELKLIGSLLGAPVYRLPIGESPGFFLKNEGKWVPAHYLDNGYELNVFFSGENYDQQAEIIAAIKADI